MKSATLVTTLTGLTTAMAVAAPVVVFGFLFLLQVHPERQAAAETRHRLTMAREELNRRRLLVRPQSAVLDAAALAAFEARIAKSGGADDAADTLTAVLNSPAVGGVSNVAVETGATADAARGSTASLFSQTVKQTPVTLSFDARYEQIGRFFRNLRVQPTTFDLQSVDLTPAGASGSGLMRAKVSLLIFHQPGTAANEQSSPKQVVDVTASPLQRRDPFADSPRSDPRPPVASNEPDPVGSDGRERRVGIARPVVPAGKR